jgi:hypothetical protein
MTISHDPVAITPFVVNCDTNDALAALTYIDDTGEVIILGTAVVTGGTAQITFDPSTITPPAALTLAVTAFNKVTYIGSVTIGDMPELPEPLNLTGIVELANHVVLNWDAPEDKSLDVTGYNVYRDNELINTEPVRDTRTYTDIVSQNGEYKYNVTALYNESGTMESEPSNTVTVVIDGMCMPFGSDIVVEQEGYNILVSWEKPEYEGTELAGYNVFRNTEQINAEILPETELSYLDEDLEPDTNYCYHIEVVYNDCEEILKSNEECYTLVSINELAGTQTVQIFPNPTDGELSVVSSEYRVQSIEIFDVMGKCVGNVETRLIASLQSEIGQSEIAFDISHLPAGIYFLRITTENNVVTRKVVKN